MDKPLSVIILGQNTILAKEILKIINLRFNKKIKIIATCSDFKLKKFIAGLFKYRIVFLSNKIRNEKKIIELIRNNKVDLIFSLQHKWIISEEIIKLTNNSIFNFHFGKIPEYRGHDPVIYSILDKQKFFFSTIHKISKTVDTGEIVSEKKIKNLDEIPRVIERKMVKTFKLQFITMINKILKKEKIKTKKIKIVNLKKFKKINSLREKKLIFNLNDLEKKTTAFNQAPHEPAFFLYNKKKYYVLKDYKEYLKYKNKK